MKKIFITLSIITASLSGFSQSVTILPTSNLGGAGSSQWTTVGNNISYGDGFNNNVGIGTSNPIYPLIVRQNNGISNQPAFLIERTNNRTPNQGFVKFGGTTANPQPVTPGELGIITFGGSTSADFLTWGLGASIRAVARGIYSNMNMPGQLEFSTTPASNPSGPQIRMTINEEGKIGINNNTPIAQLDLRYDGSSFHSVHNPMLNINGPSGNPIFVRYSNAPTNNFSIVQEATPSIALNSTNIRWRWYDNQSPSQGTTLFEWANNVFNITGALNTTGNSTIGGTNTTTGVSNLRGKVTIGTTTTASAGLEIQSNSTLVASPDIYLKSNNNIIRYGNVTGNAGMMQSVINSATPSSASMAWVHLDNAATPTQTTMMTLDGEGDLTTAGFTKLGGFGADVPAIKTKILTGNIALNTSGTTTTVAHGLTSSKIIDVKVLVSGLNNVIVSENFVDSRTTGAITGYQFSTFTDATNIYIMRHPTNGANIGNGGGLVSTYRVFVTYIP